MAATRERSLARFLLFKDCKKWRGVSMNARTRHEPFGILPWVVAMLLSLGGMQVALYADYFIVQGRLLP